VSETFERWGRNRETQNSTHARKDESSRRLGVLQQDQLVQIGGDKFQEPERDPAELRLLVFGEFGEGEDDFEEFLREGGESGWRSDLMGWWWIAMLVLERGRKKKRRRRERRVWVAVYETKLERKT